MAPTITSSMIVNSREIVEMIIDEMLEEEVQNLNLLEELTAENEEFIELRL